MATTPKPDIHDIALQLFIQMVSMDPLREPKKAAQLAYEAAQAFLDRRKQMIEPTGS